MATLFGPRRSKTGQEARLAAILDGPLLLLKRPRASRQGTRWVRELPRQGTRWAREFFGMIFGCFLDEFWPILGSFFALSNGQQSCDLAIALGPKKEQKSKKIDHFGKENEVFFFRRFVHVVCFIFYMDVHVYTNILVNLIMY